jgi:hypothetical protein
MEIEERGFAVNDFDEFAEAVGTKTIPEYTLIRIHHPWGMYTREIISPDGTKIPNDEKNNKEIRRLNKLAGKKEIKYIIREFTFKKNDFFNLAKSDKKAKTIIGRHKNDKNKWSRVRK